MHNLRRGNTSSPQSRHLGESRGPDSIATRLDPGLRRGDGGSELPNTVMPAQAGIQHYLAGKNWKSRNRSGGWQLLIGVCEIPGHVLETLLVISESEPTQHLIVGVVEH